MVFERITLINIYDALKEIETNENKVSSILINMVSKKGSKTIPRLESIDSLKKFIFDNYPFIKLDNPECECYTCTERVANLLSFTITVGEEKIFINNIRKDFQSAKSDRVNNITRSTLSNLFKVNTTIHELFVKYVCETYIKPASTYINPCDYIEQVKNKAYDDLIEKHYIKTKRPDFPGIKKINC